MKRKKPYNVFDEIADTAIDVGIKDWARNHDHYLYGTSIVNRMWRSAQMLLAQVTLQDSLFCGKILL